MNPARPLPQPAWPDLAASLAALIARVGSPLRLALLLIARAEAARLRRDIAALEDRVRARFHELFLRLVAIPDTAALLLARIAARAQARTEARAAKAAQPAPSPRDKHTTPGRGLSIAAPSLMRVVAARSSPAITPQAPHPPRKTPAPRPRNPLHDLLPQPPGGISAMPLARRLAALEHAIHAPHEVALRLLKARPELVLEAGWTPPPRTLAAAQDPPPRHRQQRRADRAIAKAHAKDKLRLKLKRRPRQAPRRAAPSRAPRAPDTS